MTNKTPAVAVLLESSHHISRMMILGILDYVRERGPWNVSLIHGGPNDIHIPQADAWRGDGLIGRIPSDAVAREIAAAHLPTVLIDPEESHLKSNRRLAHCSCISCDSKATGRMAAEHFLRLGFTSFAFVGGKPELDWSRRRETAFRERLAQDGFAPAVFPANRFSVEAERPRLMKWLARLPPATALFAANDLRGRDVLRAALLAGISVPEQLSVIGVNDDTIVCETSQPRLSSVKMDARRAGYVAAKMLDRLLRHPNEPRHAAYFSPLEIVERESSDLPHNGDPVVIEALRVIRAKAAHGLRLADVAGALGLSVRTLENHLTAAGISGKKEIERRRLDAVDRLVRSTRLPLADIARQCGYATLSHLSTTYRRTFGMPPGVVRQHG